MAGTELRITGVQVRMARAALRWAIAELASKAGVGISTVQAIERASGAPRITAGLDATREYREGARSESVMAIAAALGRAGITFLPDDGKGGYGVRAKVRD